MLAIFWFENLALTVFIGARIAAHWRATRKRGHGGGFLRSFIVTSLIFTLAHGLFLAIILGTVLEDSVNRDDVWAGLQWMMGTQAASLLLDLWTIGRWPFAEIRTRTDWMLGRVVVVHLSIIFGMFLFMWMEQPWWFFSVFVTLKALMDIGGLLPRWEPKTKKPPAWLNRTVGRIGKSPKAGGPKDETFEQYWERTHREEAARFARDEEVVGA
jgi:hypothetical protein